MPKNKATRESGKAILAAVRKEMAEPRMAKSAWKKNKEISLKAEIRPVVAWLKPSFKVVALEKK